LYYSSGRNSIGVEIDPDYCRMTARYLKAKISGLFSKNKLLFERVAPEQTLAVTEGQVVLYHFPLVMS